jgi:hypothetical protein
MTLFPLAEGSFKGTRSLDDHLNLVPRYWSRSSSGDGNGQVHTW